MFRGVLITNPFNSKKRLFTQAGWSAAAVIAVVLWFPTSAGEARARPEGTLEVRVKDHRNAIDDFKSLDLSFGKLRLAPNPRLKSSDPGVAGAGAATRPEWT